AAEETRAIQPGSDVQLAANAVVFVLDPGLFANAPYYLRGVRDRGGQHEADGTSDPQSRICEAVIASQGRRLARLGHEHDRPSDLCHGSLEGGRNRLLEQPFPQPDAQLAGCDLAQVARLSWGGA